MLEPDNETHEHIMLWKSQTPGSRKQHDRGTVILGIESNTMSVGLGVLDADI